MKSKHRVGGASEETVLYIVQLRILECNEKPVLYNVYFALCWDESVVDWCLLFIFLFLGEEGRWITANYRCCFGTERNRYLINIKKMCCQSCDRVQRTLSCCSKFTRTFLQFVPHSTCDERPRLWCWWLSCCCCWRHSRSRCHHRAQRWATLCWHECHCRCSSWRCSRCCCRSWWRCYRHRHRSPHRSCRERHWRYYPEWRCAARWGPKCATVWRWCGSLAHRFATTTSWKFRAEFGCGVVVMYFGRVLVVVQVHWVQCREGFG